ncbi:MAG: DMT family transporter [Acidimicrobiia bacterium]|nr:DMT family transporter [Acidimicrobiia bacterium]
MAAPTRAPTGSKSSPDAPEGMTAGKIVLVMARWAACFPLIEVGIARAPHLTFATLRAVLAGVVLLALATFHQRARPVGSQHWLLLVVAGLGGTTAGFLGMFHAAEFISPGLATVIANTQPLLASAMAYVLLGEIGRTAASGLTVGFAGIAIIATPGLTDPGTDDYLLGVAYGLLAALGITVGNVALKRLAGEVDALVAAGTQLLIGAVPLAALALLTEDPTTVKWSPAFVASLAGLALPGTALVYWMWISVLETIPLTKANGFSFLVPTFGLTIGIGFYDEPLTFAVATGSATVLAGVAMVHRGDAAIGPSGIAGGDTVLWSPDSSPPTTRVAP